MASAMYAARNGSIDEFWQAYDEQRPEPTRYFLDALSNHDPQARVAISNFLLDEGADATTVEQGNSAINVMLGAGEHDAELEAPLLQRLLDEGADPNRPSRRGELPFLQLVRLPMLTNEQKLPLFRVLFANPRFDLDVIVKLRGEPVPLRTYITAVGESVDQAFGQERPEN